MEMVSFFQKYNIVLGHSTAYYPQGNGLAESSNKILITIIKKVLSENKENKLVYTVEIRNNHSMHVVLQITPVDKGVEDFTV